MKKTIRILIYREDQVRLVWPISIVLVLIILGELLIVDPFGSFINKIGFSDTSGLAGHEWETAIYNILKRSARTLIVLIAIWIPLHFLMKRHFNFSGFVFSDPWISQLGLGIALGFIVQIIALFLMTCFGWYSFEGFIWDYTSVSVLLPALLLSFIYSAETGIIEESIFRGFLMNSLIDRYNLKIGVIVSSVVFGILHVTGFKTEFPWWMSLISATIAGFIFAQAYLLFRNIWVPLGIHFGVHFSARILGTVGVSPNEATFLVTQVDGPILLIVTKAGGASIFELFGYVVISFLMFIINKKMKT